MKSRIEIEAGVNGCLLISDNFTSDLTSLTKHTIGFLEQQLANQDKSRVLIVSDIEGDELVAEMFYINLSKFLKSGAVSEVVFLGSELKNRAKMFEVQRKHFFATTEEFLHSDLIGSFENKAILLKVSPEYDPKRIRMYLQHLPHDTSLEIDFDAMFHNMNYFRSKLKPTTKLMCMVKASAYGSGSIEVALAMQHYGCDYLGVAFVNEGVELRQSGIRMPIVVLNPMESSLYQLFEYKLEPEICSFRILNFVAEFARSLGLRDYPVHIKIDTGMHRAGFEEGDLERLIDFFASHTELKVMSVFSHLAAADETSDEMNDFTMSQIRLFDSITKRLESALGYKVIKHILNSAGIERFSDYQFDMVRLGVGLWGVSADSANNLRNVCSLYTKIIQIKDVKAGETVGYSRRGKVDTDKRIALVPIGYADGINRRLGNGIGYMLIDGHKAFIIGNICMDLLMLDVSDIDVKEGDKVVVFSSERPFSEIARQLDTIPYEVLASISPRVRRVYFTENIL